VTEALLLQHLESPSRTGRGRVPEPSTATVPAPSATSADTHNSTTRILTGHSALIGIPPELGLVAIEHAILRPTSCALRRYISRVYRTLVMIPKSADPAEVETLIEGIASSFKASAGSQPVTRSLGSLMGPGAKAGEAGWIFEADFPTLEDAMTALDAKDFQDAKVRTETLGSTIFLFQVGEV
jgi:hypothetical protein